MMIKSQKVAASLVLFSALGASGVTAGEYCAGIRGNGELAPAHWASLARIVEHKGLPTKVAGGSSASITMFSIDAISRNQNLSTDNQTKANEQALLFKSLVPHIKYLYTVDAKSPVIMRLVGNITGLADGGFGSALKKALKIGKDLPTFMRVLGEYGHLLNPELIIGLKNNFSFYKGQIAEAAKTLGAFDALKDQNIFFREGIVDFKYLGMLFGRVADFYAGYGADKVNVKLTSFLNECSSDSVGKTWNNLMAVKPVCSELLTDALDAYYEAPIIKKTVTRIGKAKYTKMIRGKRKFPNKMIFEKVGSGLEAFPTTAIVVNDAAKRYTELKKEYEKKEAKDFTQFKLDFYSDLKYGYFGNSESLIALKNNLSLMYPGDTKTGRFMPIHGATWFDVLATSPAEPGLSPLTRIPDGENLNKHNIINKKFFYKKWRIFPTWYAIGWHNENNPSGGVVPFREGIYSAGGWSDLHPTLVLKGSGCEDVVYITRQGGESIFGQQVFIRLTGYTDKISFWKNLKEHNRDGWWNLSDVEEKSPWNRLYNLANPASSFNLSLENTTAVYCTNWDSHNLFKGELDAILDEAYNAPLILNDKNKADDYNFGQDRAGKSQDNFPGCIVKNFN